MLIFAILLRLDQGRCLIDAMAFQDL
ncbi:hypothetical protein DSUL_30092 [Desulfovibrionales bacterium]